MKIIKIITEETRWITNNYCCDTMENTIADENIQIDKGQAYLTIPRYRMTIKNGNLIYYCPFCGKKIESE